MRGRFLALAATLTRFPFSFTFMSPRKSFVYGIPFWCPLLRKLKTITSGPSVVRENGQVDGDLGLAYSEQ